MIEDLEPLAILRALGYRDIGSVTPLQGGRDTAMFRVERGDEVFALRVFRPDQFETSRREQRAMSIAREGGVPVPVVHAHGIREDRPVLLLSWCGGRTVLDAAIDRLDQAGRLGEACGRTLARIHTIVVPEEDRDLAWLDRVLMVGEPLYLRLEAIARSDRLLHLDFHPLNVMIEGETITCVLDWANARCGDPRADLARSLSILRLDADELARELRPALRAFERGLVRAYTEVSGPLDDMPLFLAWAGRYMLRDRHERLTLPQRRRVERWTAWWTRRAGVG